MKPTNKSIECIINNDLSIKLENVVEVYGHDDSIPFNADVFVYDSEDESGCYHKIATSYNDGWGGESVINATQTRYEKQLDKIDTFLREHYEIVTKLPSSGKELKWDVKLEYLISCMVCYCLDMNISRMKVTDLDGCEEKK